MRNWLPILLLVIYSCSGSAGREANREDQAPNKPLPNLKGLYTGDFDGSPIVLRIDYQEFRSIAGIDTHKGLSRNIHGKAVWEGDEVVMDLWEPGTNPYDGKFTIRLKPPFKTAAGTWTPVDKGKKTAFTLQIDSFGRKMYDPEQNHWYDGAFTSRDHNKVVFINMNERTATFQLLEGDSSHQTFISYPGNFQLTKDSNLVIYLRGYAKDTVRMKLSNALEGEGDDKFRNYQLYHEGDTLHHMLAY